MCNSSDHKNQDNIGCLWFQDDHFLMGYGYVVVKLEVALKEVQKGVGEIIRPRHARDRPREGAQEPPRPSPKPIAGTGGVGFQCFCCNQPGHRAAKCPAPSPRKATPVGSATPMKKLTESSRVPMQHVSPGARKGSSGATESAAVARYQPEDDEDSPDDSSADPMVKIPAARAHDYTRHGPGAVRPPDSLLGAAMPVWMAASLLPDSGPSDHHPLPERAYQLLQERADFQHAEPQLTPACWGNAGARTQQPSGTAGDEGERRGKPRRTLQAPEPNLDIKVLLCCAAVACNYGIVKKENCFITVTVAFKNCTSNF
ncbi:epididymal sperm-binding protein 1 [Crotalus adamanteus]|uniref:Epididymal sperm-binding protein 1 n=1 Tax=Crotalus adamanteus TaxID=8729 RepID=A0AAW1B684_CROAD